MTLWAFKIDTSMWKPQMPIFLICKLIQITINVWVGSSYNRATTLNLIMKWSSITQNGRPSWYGDMGHIGARYSVSKWVEHCLVNNIPLVCQAEPYIGCPCSCPSIMLKTWTWTYMLSQHIEFSNSCLLYVLSL